MTDRIPCFLLEPATGERRWLRRYSVGNSLDIPVCPRYAGNISWERYHDALTLLGDFAEESHSQRVQNPEVYARTNARWPTKCEACDYAFSDEDQWQLFASHLYRRSDNGELTTLREAPPGALWYATWYEGFPGWRGPDGKILICKTPGGEWNIDSRASNCTLPEDEDHRCWVRHGTPPAIHVDKNGVTCNAGAGSIDMHGNYHGFLHNGELVKC